ncbi:hypothetical protein F5888DRAFT_129356 [Russula emetica]|nr:hypothetical protein F5888DRAFT_129356 [Russula emetica]
MSYRSTPGEEPSPSNLRSQGTRMNAVATPNDGPGPASGPGAQLASDGHFDFYELELDSQPPLAPFIQPEGALQHNDPLLQRNPGSIYSGGPSRESNLSNFTATPSSGQGYGGGGVPSMPYGGPPMALPNVPSGQAGIPGANFQVAGQPATMTWQDLHPEIFARPDAHGIPGPLWELSYASLDYQGGDDVRVVIHFRRIRSP